jgi:hypothetical protein
LGNLSTPKKVQKLLTALHAKAKAEAGYRFYALYDKIGREDILAHAYAQCRSNKGAPGVDGQDFADIEAYGVQRWLGELALALRQETYRPDPIRRVYIPKANGKPRLAVCYCVGEFTFHVCALMRRAAPSFSATSRKFPPMSIVCASGRLMFPVQVPCSQSTSPSAEQRPC